MTEHARPRVLHLITDLDIGGAEMMLVRLVDISKDESETMVVSLTSGGRLVHRLTAVGVRVISLGMHPRRTNAFSLFRLYRLLRTFRPQILQTWLYGADFLGLVAGTLASVPAVVWNIRCSDLSPSDLGGRLRMLRKMLAAASGRPSAIVFNSEAGQRVHARLGYRPRRSAIIPNGFDTVAFAPSPAAHGQLCAELGVPPTTLMVGSLGRFHPVKDYPTFLAAASIVSSQRPDVTFVLAGRGIDENDRLRTLANDLNGPVRLLPERSDAAHLLAAFDVAVSSSTSEGFPNVLAEAMACATPCVTTDVGDAAKIVDDTGCVVPARNPSAMANAILRLLAMSSSEREALGRRARARVIAEYSLSRAAARYRALYDELLVSRTT